MQLQSNQGFWTITTSLKLTIKSGSALAKSYMSIPNYYYFFTLYV